MTSKHPDLPPGNGKEWYKTASEEVLYEARKLASQLQEHADLLQHNIGKIEINGCEQCITDDKEFVGQSIQDCSMALGLISEFFTFTSYAHLELKHRDELEQYARHNPFMYVITRARATAAFRVYKTYMQNKEKATPKPQRDTAADTHWTNWLKGFKRNKEE